MYCYVSKYRRTLSNAFTCYEEFFMTSHVVPCNCSDGRVESPHFYSVWFGCDIKLWFSVVFIEQWDRKLKLTFFLNEHSKGWHAQEGLTGWSSGSMLAISVTQIMLRNKHVSQWCDMYLKSGTCHEKHLKI